jgi:hypothetical protein
MKNMQLNAMTLYLRVFVLGLYFKFLRYPFFKILPSGHF